MAFDSLSEAAEALAAANAGEAPASEEASVVAPAEAEGTSEVAVEQPNEAQVEEGTTVEDSFTKVDLNSLTEGLEPEVASRVEEAYKAFQSDYTRKMQEASPYRKVAEEFGDVDSLRQSAEFVQNLRTDPNFAVAVHNELTAALEDAGLTPAEAEAEASRQVDGMGESDPFDGFEFDSDDPRDMAIQELMQFKQEYEELEHERELEAMIQRQEMAIRQSHPDYTDADMDEIVKLSFAHGGDLFAAEKDFTALRDRLVSAYMESKQSVQTRQPQTPTPTHHGEQQQTFDSVDAAHKAAQRHLAALLAQG